MFFFLPTTDVRIHLIDLILMSVTYFTSYQSLKQELTVINELLNRGISLSAFQLQFPGLKSEQWKWIFLSYLESVRVSDITWLLGWETSVGLYTGVNVEITSLSSFLSFHTAVRQIDTRSPKKTEIRNEFGQMMEWKLDLLLMSHDEFMFCYWLITNVQTCSRL